MREIEIWQEISKSWHCVALPEMLDAITMNLKGPQPREPEDKPKVSKWILKIQELEQRVTALEIYIKDLELDCAQARLALVNLTDGLAIAQGRIQKGLTSNPFPFDPEQKKVWDDPKSVPHTNPNPPY